jgi:ubiquinone/menaquinone biosynthesis C-methylase UbiE/uncharacterized protein YbaR (Trm112 family)
MIELLNEKLRCPIDKGVLELIVFEEEVIGISNFKRIKNGILLNARLKVFYPIQNFVPVLLRFPTSFHQIFAAKFKEELKPYQSYKLPNLSCEKGERFIQKTFTDEWNLTQDNELSFQRNDEDLVNLNKEVWLSWLKKGAEINSLLNVGCGIGKETIALETLTGAKDIVAIDLNFALLQAGERYKENPNINFIICSLFHPPLQIKIFDLVYSQGVIHHTYSTYTAFKSISRFVKQGKYLFIWVYGLEDHLCFRNSQFDSVRNFGKNVIAHLFWYTEILIRPWLSRAPKLIRDIIIFIMSICLHPLIKMRVLHKSEWRLKNTEHGLRDTYTPVYAYRHSVNEVMEWYEESSFEIIDFQSPLAHKEVFNGKRIHGIGMTGQKLDENKI